MEEVRTTTFMNEWDDVTAGKQNGVHVAVTNLKVEGIEISVVDWQQTISSSPGLTNNPTQLAAMEKTHNDIP
jgi:hypothetical protein